MPSMSWEVIEFFSKLFIRDRPLLNFSQVGVIKYLLFYSLYREFVYVFVINNSDVNEVF
nr:MAG TPA_asm: hypothetical protein [Caudoviricetes sp.]